MLTDYQRNQIKGEFSYTVGITRFEFEMLFNTSLTPYDRESFSGH